jgi:hypothetical protein
MAKASFSGRVKILQSQSGKLDVLVGALSGRLALRETFLRESKAFKSFGNIVSLEYEKGCKERELFPNAMRDGGFVSKDESGKLRIKVIEWAVPVVCICVMGMCGCAC